MTRLLLLLALFACACRSQPKSPYTAAEADEAARDPARAEELNREAAEQLAEEDLEAAERLLRLALEADLFFGPAHNNLGVVHLERGKLYEAAHEFEWARKLLPGHPDPRVNLAIALDRAGMQKDAREAFEAALETHPGYVPAIQGLARVHLQGGSDDPRVPGWLRRIVMEGEGGAWREWARERLSALPASRD